MRSSSPGERNFARGGRTNRDQPTLRPAAVGGVERLICRDVPRPNHLEATAFPARRATSSRVANTVELSYCLTNPEKVVIRFPCLDADVAGSTQAPDSGFGIVRRNRRRRSEPAIVPCAAKPLRLA